mgnify:CR=1 FL=1
MNRSNTLAVLAGLLLLILGGAVSADDGRINPPPYHFGGDTLYCDQGAGCSLLNLNGTLLGTWAESDIAAALAAVDQTGQNSLVGEVSGTYGTASLWAVPTSETNGNRQLCMIGYDEWGKRNDMCFAVTTDGKYLPAPLALGHVADCSMFSVGWWVRLIADHDIEGEIESIDATNGTVTFYIGKGHTYTASCDAVERIF